jgi:hypothetical protein
MKKHSSSWATGASQEGLNSMELVMGQANGLEEPQFGHVFYIASNGKMSDKL